MEAIQLICPYSGEKFTPKRSNQRFRDAKARNDYYNQIAKEIRKIKSVADKPLAKNFKALSELLGGAREKVFHREYLLGRGIDPRYFTHHIGDGAKTTPVYYTFSLSKVPDKPDYIRVEKIQ